MLAGTLCICLLIGRGVVGADFGLDHCWWLQPPTNPPLYEAAQLSSSPIEEEKALGKQQHWAREMGSQIRELWGWLM